MARKTNCKINGKEYYRIYRKVGMKPGPYGIWVDDRKAFYGSSKKEAEEKYAAYMKKKQVGISESTCLGEIIDQWHETVFMPSGLAEGTKENYSRAYKKHFRSAPIAGRLPEDVTALDLQEFYNASGLTYGALKPLNNFLRRFYKYAELTGICKDITGCVTVPKNNPGPSDNDDIDVWSDEDLKKVINALEGNTLRLLIVLAVNTGARISELLALTYNDIRDNMLYINKQVSEVKSDGVSGIHITEPKTSCSNRVIPLSDPVMAEIRKHTALHKAQMLQNGYRTDFIFTTSNGSLYYRRNVARALQRLYKRIGIPYHKFHAYRHTFGTNLSRAGVPIEETAKLMGHADITVTARYYIGVNANRKREAVQKIATYSL